MKTLRQVAVTTSTGVAVCFRLAVRGGRKVIDLSFVDGKTVVNAALHNRGRMRGTSLEQEFDTIATADNATRIVAEIRKQTAP